MQHTARIMLFLVVGVVATGCNKPTDKESKANSDDPGTAAAQRDKAMTATKEAAQSVQDYAYAQKGEFIDAAKRGLSDIRAEMERLRAVVDHSTGAARADAEAKLEVVSDKWAAAKAQLDRAEAATDASWEDVQNRYRTVRSDLKSSFDMGRHADRAFGFPTLSRSRA
jgi:hypothetical protein